jgi:tRNA splicing endonuclease
MRMGREEVIERMKLKFINGGFHIRDGLKYGADLLLYTDDPSVVHSKYAFLLDDDYTFLQIIAVQRVCSSSGKELIVGRMGDNDVILYSVDRFRETLAEE